MIWHNASPEEVIDELSTNVQTGLSEQEAKKRIGEYGRNLSVCEEEISMTGAIISQLKKPPVIVLFTLLIIYVLRELVTGNNSFVLPIAAILILAFKETLCIYSEYRSRNMLSMLKNRIHTSARVIRDGIEKTINAEELVPGDIILLNEGDFVPADARILEATALRCDESHLYDEKEVIAVQKDATALHDDHIQVRERTNMLYCGCHIMTGTAKAVVTGTGEEAEIRRAVKKDKVFVHKGIQDRIADRFSGFYKVFRASALAACMIIAVLATFVTRGHIGWGKFLEALITSVCFYIAVVPGSFPTRIACLFSLGIKRLEKDHAVIFNPQTVEKLAGVTVICSDKTGVLTQNKMSLRKVYDGEKTIDLSSDSISKQCEIAMRFGTLSCDTNSGEASDHTEASIVTATSRFLNITKSDFDAEFPRVASIALTPERKIKTSVNMIDGKVFAIVRGAPDIILDRCVGADTESITKAYEKMCSEGLRVLAISYRILDDIPSEPASENLEYGLQFLGLFGISDRERRGVADDIELCRRAGISTVMFTGDHINTAASQAQKMGILKSDDLSVTGEQIDELSDEELAAVVGKIKVCARISPEGRTRMVNALHKNSETVLLTADSAANYAPMAVADVGCAMGKTGTDVAKGNADVVIYDDRFGTIVKTIRNARGIFGNLSKYINYYTALCTCTFFSIVLCTLFSRTVPFDSSVVLLGSIFAFLFPIASIGFETADPGIMKTSPRTIGEKMFDIKQLVISAAIGAGAAVPTLIVYLINRGGSPKAACLISLVFSLIFLMFSTRSTEFFYKRIIHNRFLLALSAACAIILVLITITPAGLVFGLEIADGKAWLTGLLIPLVIPAALEITKLCFKLKNK